MSTLLVHAASTWFMVGLIWTIQLVHYPLFARVGAEGFIAYEADHTRRMGWLLALPATIEVVTGGLLVWLRPDGVPLWLVIGTGFLLFLIWLVTISVQVPNHVRLSQGFDLTRIEALVASNRWRALLWTLRGAGVASMVVLAI
ncbi:MAG: hypothetical protein HKN46_09845 [Acidimicrobiia bacterium]|nr:hypothetical protein [Acidimicrobiia bacterium]